MASDPLAASEWDSEATDREPTEDRRAESDPLEMSNWTISRKSAKFKASSADGCAATDGKSSSRNTLNRLTPRACARGTGNYIQMSPSGGPCSTAAVTDFPTSFD